MTIRQDAAQRDEVFACRLEPPEPAALLPLDLRFADRAPEDVARQPRDPDDSEELVPPGPDQG